MSNRIRDFKPSVTLLLSVSAVTVFPSPLLLTTRADIYEWEWINPADPSQGKKESMIPVPDGVGLTPGRYVDLSGYNLTKAYLIEHDLFGARFLSTNLTNADLTNANLQHTELNNAILSDAVLDGADVEYAVLSSTTDSGFTYAQMQSTYSYQVSGRLEGIELDDNAMSGWDFSQKYLRYATFQNANLTGADFTNANLNSADFTGADLSGATLNNARFEQTTFTNAIFTGAHITGAIFKDSTQYGFTFSQLQSTADYQAGNLTGIYMSNLYMAGWDFSGQEMSGAILVRSDLTGADLSDANLSGANLDYANFENANLNGADLTNTWIGRDISFASTTDSGFTFGQFQSTVHYQNALFMQNIDLSQNDLSGWDFTGLEIVKLGLYQSNLTGTDLSQAELRDVDLRESNLTNARLVGTYLGNAYLTDADLTGAIIAGTVFSKVYSLTFQQISSTASYQTGDMNGITLSYQDMTGWDLGAKEMADAYLGFSTLNDAVFQYSNLSGADFVGAVAQRTDFHRADMTGAQLDGLDASNADFSDANLSNTKVYRTNLTGADLTGALIHGAHLINATGYGLTHLQFQSTASYQNGNLDGLKFNDNDLSGWDLSNQSLIGSSFKDTTMTGVDLSGSDLTDATLRDLDLKNLGFTGAILEGAEIDGTSFESTTDSGLTFAQIQSTKTYQDGKLEGVNLSYNDLSGWSFHSVYLLQTSFEGSVLSGVDFDEAIFGNTNILGADLTDATIKDARLSGTTGSGLTFQMFNSTRSYQENNLGRLWLGYNDLTGWRFVGLNLYQGYLAGSYLTDADFSGANLIRADFADANLGGADLTGADARRATGLSLAGNTVTRNFIHPDGHVDGLVLGPNETMRIWDSLEYGPLPIYILQELTLDPASILRLVVERDTWNSTITFEPGAAVTLDGILELDVDPSVDPLALFGIDLQLFDWSGVTSTGTFDQIIGTPGPDMTWDTSRLYSQGIVTASHLGDLNGDRFIGLDDLDLILRNWNQSTPPADPLADPSGDGYVGLDDLVLVLEAWNAGHNPAPAIPVPEPLTATILSLAWAVCLQRQRNNRLS